MLSGGAVLRGVGGEGSRLHPDGLTQAFAATNWGDNHHSQPAVLSLTLPTDLGALYRPEEVTQLATAAKERGLRVHLDGARLANALAAMGATPAELTWKAGVDVLTLGATKNGAVSTDAIVCFDPAAADQLHYRTKRAGHVASKMRFQSVQLDAYLTRGYWIELAAQANRTMVRLAAGLEELGLSFLCRPEVNLAFVYLADEAADRVSAAGLDFYRMGPGLIRLVTSFQTTLSEVDEALGRFAVALGGR